MKGKITIFILLAFQLIYSQDKNSKIVEGIFLFEWKYLVFNIYTDTDAILQGPALLEYTNNFENLYKGQYLVLASNAQLLKDRKQQSLHRLFDYENDYELRNKINGIPTENYLIDIRGLKYFLIYLKAEVNDLGLQNIYIPVSSDPKKGYVKMQQIIKVNEIIKILDYKVINPEHIFPNRN